MIVLAVLTLLFTYPTARNPNTLVRRSHVGWRRVAVRGPSMSPALHDGDVVLVRFGASAQVGDVVLVRWAARPGQLSVKRASTDSRHLGPAQVVAVVRLRLWPRPGRIRAGR